MMNQPQRPSSFLNLMGPHHHTQRYLAVLAEAVPDGVRGSRAYALVNVLATDGQEARWRAEQLVQARGLVAVAVWPLPEAREIMGGLEQSVLSSANPAQLNWCDPYVKEMDLESEADTNAPEDNEANCCELDDGESDD